jgi:two-component system CheB/CheR fusion protein
VTQRQVLIVDDDRNNVETLSMLVDMTGSAPHSAFDGLEAVEVAEKVRPQVILLDIALPKLNGYEVCRRIREQSWGKDIVVVALTGLGHEDDRLKSRQAGFDMHLVKPVQPEHLMIVLSAAA